MLGLPVVDPLRVRVVHPHRAERDLDGLAEAKHDLAGLLDDRVVGRPRLDQLGVRERRRCATSATSAMQVVATSLCVVSSSSKCGGAAAAASSGRPLRGGPRCACPRASRGSGVRCRSIGTDSAAMPPSARLLPPPSESVGDAKQEQRGGVGEQCERKLKGEADECRGLEHSREPAPLEHLLSKNVATGMAANGQAANCPPAAL